jgi:hypothetical protein
MKEASAHINTPALQNRTQPFFQRTADETREDSAFFSGVQAKLSVGAKDDPYEKEADAMADKVINKKTIQAKLTVGALDDPYEKEADAMADKVVNKKPGDVQMKAEEQKEEEKKEVEEEAVDKKISKKPVADSNDTNEDKVQRMCRECDEGDKVFLSADPAISGMSKRDAVIAVAKTMLGKIKAKQPGGGDERYGAKELWEIFKLAAPGIWSEEDIKTLGKPYPSWCGIFSVWAHKKAGIDLGNWQIGKGVTAFGTLKQTTSPQAGDIGYIHDPFQHHCIVTKVNGDTIDSIDGNSGWFSEVIENTRPRTAYTSFYTAFSGSESSTINKKENQTNSGIAPSSVESSLASSKGGGMGLPEKTRSEMESGFGADFSNVKIHTDSNAVQMSKDLNAQAFTHGSDIYFNQNKYDTGSTAGKHLLAHELTHTIQQGAAGVQKKSKPSPTPLISKKTAAGNWEDKDVTVSIQGQVYKVTVKETGKEYQIDVSTQKQLDMPEISMPKFKERNAAKYPSPILSVRGRGKTFQVKNWEAGVSSSVNSKVSAFLKDMIKKYAGRDNLDPDYIFYFRLSNKKDFHIIGNVKTIQELSYIPKWNRKAKPNNHQVDHIVEYQLGGEDQPENTPSNYELLDAKANMSSGNAIRKERKRRVEEALKIFNDLHNDPNSAHKGKFVNLPDGEKVAEEYISSFKKIADWKLHCNGDGEMRWTYEELTGKNLGFLEPLERMPDDEVNALKPKQGEIMLYAGEGIGIPKRLNKSFSGTIENFFKGMELIALTMGKGKAPGSKGTIDFKLSKKFTKKMKENQPLTFDLMPVKDGRPDTYFIKSNKLFNKNLFKKFEPLSPVTVNDVDIEENRGIVISGNIQCDAKLVNGLSIDFWLTGEELGFSTSVDLSILKKFFPKPFELTNANLELSYSSNDDTLGLTGNIDFAIAKLGTGSITGGKSQKGLVAAGQFTFDKKLFDGHLEFTYEEKKWTISGSAKMDGKKLKGIKSAKVDFTYSQEKEKLHVGGEATLTVPGISKVVINTDIGSDGDFNVSAEVMLSKIPRIKSGKVTVTIGKTKPKDGQPSGDGEWDLGIDGKIDPDFEYAGLSDVSTKFNYAKGTYDISISAKYKKGKFHADKIEVGITNKPVSKKGEKQEGEPTNEMTFYGGFEMGVDIYEGIGGTIACTLLPDGDVTLDGTVEVQEDKELFSMKPWEKELLKVDKDIPIASCVVVTLNLYIGGQIKLYADLKPLMIKKGSNLKIGNLSLKKFDDPVITSKIIVGSSLVAGAKVALAVGLSASLLGVIKARISGVADVNFVAIESAITGVLDMGWSKETGVEINEASISLEMASKLIVAFGVKAEVLLDLWLTTITLWDHEWPVAAETFPIDIFGEGKKTWKLPLQSGGKVGEPKMDDNLKDVSDKAKPDEVQSRAEDKSKGVSRPKVNKQAEVQKVTQDEVLARFHDKRRFDFNSSEDYTVTRYGLYDYLKEHSGMDPKIDFGFIDDEIKKAEFEEYDKFTTHIMNNELGFNDDQKAIIIEDFIVNHPTLGDVEITNLRSLIPVKAAPSQKASSKERGKSQPKQTPDIPSPVKPPYPVTTTVQKKSKTGGPTKKSGNSASPIKNGKQSLKNKLNDSQHESEEGNELGPPLLTNMNGFEEAGNNEDNDFKPFYMRPFTRTRKPLQQRAEEKSKPFFSGPDKKEKKANNAFFQTKLNVGEVDDPLEKEADRVADAVTGKGVQKEERKEDIAKGAGIEKPEQEANKGKTPGADKPAIADKAAMQEEKKEKTPVQRKENNEKEEETNTPVNKKDNAPGHTASKANSVETAIGQKNGKGESIPANTLQEMQTAFGSDFSDVRIHTDSEAATLSNELDAQAFTTGKDIYFNTGKFDPDSESGKHLLAHELTHVLQQNKDSIQRDPKKDKEEKDRAQKVRDNYQKALKAKSVNWEEVALYFNAFNTAEQRSKMAQLNGNQLFRLHQGAINAAGVGPWSAAALITTPIPGMESAVAAAIEEKMLGYNYQEAIDLMIEYLDKKGIIDRTLLWGGTMRYLYKDNLHGEGRILAPGFDQTTGKAKPTSANIGSDAFRPSTGLPLLYSTIIHEYQHVQQMQKKDESKALIPDQGNDDNTHLQQEVEAYATELVRAKESGLFHNPEEVEGAWNRLQSKWEVLSDDRKKILNDIYKKAYTVAKEALGKKSFLVYTPLK